MKACRDDYLDEYQTMTILPCPWSIPVSQSIWELYEFSACIRARASESAESGLSGCLERSPNDVYKQKGVQRNFNIMDNDKNHSIVHGGNEIAKYTDVINMSCESPEDWFRVK